MDSVTLFLTRFPHDEFLYDDSGARENVILDDVDDLEPDIRKRLYRTAKVTNDEPANRKRISGLWGTMLMLTGPVVTYAAFHNASVVPLKEDERSEEVDFAGRKLFLTVKGGDIASTKEFTTQERYRTDTGYVDRYDIGYVRLVGRSDPYGLYVETGNEVVKTMRAGHDGLCIRITGAASGPQRGILIHELRNPKYLIGCISPRPLDDRGVFDNNDTNKSRGSVLEVVAKMKKASGKGQLYVVRN